MHRSSRRIKAKAAGAAQIPSRSIKTIKEMAKRGLLFIRFLIIDLEFRGFSGPGDVFPEHPQQA